ncbi:MAG TPA: hypothetical protein VMO17_06965, partial [Terriglobia bacterium]|nr:hypothetical protein [Terriglobia bacterium]
GATNLPYYGIVSTPVIDHAGSNNPTLFVVSACTPPGTNQTGIQWFLDAVDLTTGTTVAPPQAISGPNFHPQNQLSRASLLVTHPSGAGYNPYIYVAFGAGAREVGKLDDTSTYQYSGALFVYKYTYGSLPTFSQPASPFFTECLNGSCPTTSVFPSGNLLKGPYTLFDGFGYPDGPAGPSTTIPPKGNSDCTLGGGGAGGCSPGGLWGINGGGLWQSMYGPSSTSAANVYVASGNGAFACSGSAAPCLISSPVQYWGQSSMQFPAGNSTSPTTPQDFFAPYVLRYTCPYNTTCSANMPNIQGTLVTDQNAVASTTQTQELSRLDLDLGVGGDVILPHSAPGVSTYPFSMTSDKSSYLYVLPPAVGETGLSAGGLGQFRTGDAGLTDSRLPYTTQTPFQLNRQPSGTRYVCETVDATGAVSGGCDEVHGLPWFSTFDSTDSSFHDLLFTWPANEAVEDWIGTLQSTYKNYYFATTFGVPPTSNPPPPTFDPCPLPFTSTNCAVTAQNPNPPFPRSSNAGSSAGAPMALASTISNTTPSADQATLWAIVPQANTAAPPNGPANLGALYGYHVVADPTNSSFGSLASGTNGVASGTYVSGINPTGTPGSSCLLTFTGTGIGGTSSGYALLTMQSNGTVSTGEALTIIGTGAGYASAPMQATASPYGSNPPTGCTGTATVTTALAAATAPIWYWNPVLGFGNTCQHTPSGITSWFPPAFTEPTLADNQQNQTTSTGTVYVPAVCILQDSGFMSRATCGDAAHHSTLLSGVLVFTTCN